MTAHQTQEIVQGAIIVIASLEIIIEMLAVIIVIYKLLKRGQLSLLSRYVQIIMSIYLF